MKALACFKKYILATVLVCFCLGATAQVAFIEESNGNITVRTEGTNKKVPNAISDAERYVFYIVFYRGIPGSTLTHGLIDITEAEAEQKYKDYFDAFYKGRYQSFITTVAQNGPVVKEKRRQKNISFDMTINTAALRKDLEENGVIRKFGF